MAHLWRRLLLRLCRNQGHRRKIHLRQRHPQRVPRKHPPNHSTTSKTITTRKDPPSILLDPRKLLVSPYWWSLRSCGQSVVGVATTTRTGIPSQAFPRGYHRMRPSLGSVTTRRNIKECKFISEDDTIGIHVYLFMMTWPDGCILVVSD